MHTATMHDVITFASSAHNGQVRKYDNTPYISHPFSVAGIVSSVSRDHEMIMAAFLHDVVEDTPVEIEEIRNRFGDRVAVMVADLTDVSRPEDGNRAVRKRIDRLHTGDTCPEAKSIKLADLIDNTRLIVGYDPNFAKVYMEEKRLLLEVLKEGDEQLYKLASSSVEEFFA